SAAWYRGIKFAVEFAALFVELENRARDRSRQHRHRQTERTDADDRIPVVRNLSRSGIAKWRAQRRPRHGAKCRSRDHRASEDQHYLVHRWHGHWTQSRRSVRTAV